MGEERIVFLYHSVKYKRTSNRRRVVTVSAQYEIAYGDLATCFAENWPILTAKPQARGFSTPSKPPVFHNYPKTPPILFRKVDLIKLLEFIININRYKIDGLCCT